MTLLITVRLARSDDLAKRMELVRQGFSAHFWDAFWYFFLQELTLECCVMAAAVLFIFGGASVSACAALVPAAAAFVMAAVACTHWALAEKHAQGIQREWFGVVAEAHAAAAGGPARGPLQFHFEMDAGAAAGYAHLVGTASVSEDRELDATGWLHALAVHTRWRARGVGRALAGGAGAAGAARGLHALGAAASHLQPAARAALMHAGWRCRGAPERQLLGNTLTLPLVRLELDLPPGPPGPPDRRQPRGRVAFQIS